jgi:uncharacterized lipoprotein NlpE involved in copper resistance
MKTTFRQHIIMILTLSAISCGQSPRPIPSSPEKIHINSAASIGDQHNSSNSLDWGGRYKGTLPCADCEGIITELTLNLDKTYLLKISYLGKGDNSVEEKGTFSWNETGNIITLAGLKNRPNQYFVGENILIQLDMMGNRITGNLAENYILRKH